MQFEFFSKPELKVKLNKDVYLDFIKQVEHLLLQKKNRKESKFSNKSQILLTELLIKLESKKNIAPESIDLFKQLMNEIKLELNDDELFNKFINSLIDIDVNYIFDEVLYSSKEKLRERAYTIIATLKYE